MEFDPGSASQASASLMLGVKAVFAALLFTPWLFLGISFHLEPLSGPGDALVLLGVHLLFLSLLWLIIRRTRKSPKGTFIGYSSFVWIAGSIASYMLGFLAPVLA